MRQITNFAGCVVFSLFAVNLAHGQTNYNWGFTGTDWNSAASWSPAGGPPTAGDTANFDLNTGTTFGIQPSFSTSASVGRLNFLSVRGLSNFTFTGNANTLTFGTGGAMADSALSFRGGFGQSLIFNNLQTNIASGTSLTGNAAILGAMEFAGPSSRLQLTNNSAVRLSNAAGTANYDLTVNGTQLLLTAGSSLTNGIGNTAAQGRLQFQSNSLLSVTGANATTATITTSFAMNQAAIQSGHTTISLSPGFNNGANIANVQLTLGNGTLQSGLDRFIRDSAGAVVGLGTGTVQFTSNDVMPTAFGGTRSHLFLAPGATGIATQNGVITEGTSSNTNTPYVIITGTISGVTGVATRFATMGANGEVLAQGGTTRTEANISAAAPNENLVYRPTTAAANAALANPIAVQTLVVEPRGSAQILDVTGQTLTANGIALSGLGNAANFNITGGTLAGSAAADRTFFIANANSFLNIGSNFAGSSSGAIVKSGAGILSLTANTDQMAFSAITDVAINSGNLRARVDGPNANFGTTNNNLQIRGGNLEIDAGGGTANFTRPLGVNAGQVNWTGGVASQIHQDRGNGGFSAFNGNVNINLGGAGQTLTWNGSGTDRFFLRSGSSLALGSSTQNGLLNFQNAIALDNGSVAAPRESRLVTATQLTTNTPAIRSILSGVISGGPNTLLALGGTGYLELTAANTYAGGTIIDTATVAINNSTGSGTGSGPVFVTRGILVGNGTIAPAAGNGVTVSGPSGLGGFLITDSQFLTPGHMKIGTDGVNNPVTFEPGANFASRIHGGTFDTNGGAASYGRLTVRGTGAITVSGAAFSFGLSNTFTPNSGDTFGILDNQTGAFIGGFFNGIAQDATVTITRENNSTAGTIQVSYLGNIAANGVVTPTGGNDLVLYNFTPVPEPMSVFGLTFLAAAVVGRVRRGRSERTSL